MHGSDLRGVDVDLLLI